MKTNNQNWDSNNQPSKTDKQHQVNQPRVNKNNTDKKGTYIKDMPPIDGAKPGVI